MIALVFAARVLLAALFTVAGLAKLADRAGTRKTVEDFGVRSRAAGALAVALPVLELTVAGLLLPASTALYGALGALVLLGLFTGAIAWSLARGRAPDCHCFGQLHSAPASSKTLARNVVLLAVAAFALAGSLAEPPASAVAWIGRPRGRGAACTGHCGRRSRAGRGRRRRLRHADALVREGSRAARADRGSARRAQASTSTAAARCPRSASSRAPLAPPSGRRL